jgi:hypothetical protein
MGDGGIFLTQRAVQRIADAVDWVERQAPGLLGGECCAPAAGAYAVAPVRVSSATPDGTTGFYPGFIQLELDSTGIYTDGEAIWLMDDNGGTLAVWTGTARLRRIHTDGKAIYAPAGGGGPTIDVVTNVCSSATPDNAATVIAAQTFAKPTSQTAVPGGGPDGYAPSVPVQKVIQNQVFSW